MKLISTEPTTVRNDCSFPNTTPRRSFRRVQTIKRSRTLLNRLLCGWLLPLSFAWAVGCGVPESPAPLSDESVEREVELAFHAAEAHLGIPSVTAPSTGLAEASETKPATLRSGRPTTQLARFAARSSGSRHRDVNGVASGGGQQPASPTASEAVALIQTPADQPPAESLTEQPPVETIPTPAGQQEPEAEAIPTPPGVPIKPLQPVRPPQPNQPQPNPPKLEVPRPAARIAADPDPTRTTDSNAKPDTIETGAAATRAPGQPALVDPGGDSGVVDTAAGPEDFKEWRKPDVVLFVTGDQHGYIEPCGCTGLENQKGGVARRFTFLGQLRQRGWDMIPIDAGNQIRRIGKQAAIKFEKSANALSQMDYESVGFGPGDMNLSVGELIATTYPETPEDAMFVSANIVLIDPEFLPSHKIVRDGEWKIGLTSILDPEALEAPVGSDVTINPIKSSAEKVLGQMKAAGANFRVLTFFGEEDVAKELMADVPGFDLIVVSGGYGEPTYRPQSIEGSETKMIVTGNKGMYVGLVGLYQDKPMKYARVPLTHEYEDAPEMRRLMAEYQQQLEQLGLSGLGISPTPHLSGHKFVGTESCAKCHTSAYEVWQYSAHADATKHIVEPTEGRGDVPRHFDPECLSCHVTGWDPQGYKPYESGYWSLADTSHLTANGCENCHGPGSAHVAAEQEGSTVSEADKVKFREQMQLPLDKAKEHCMKCHDLDNSPDFHNEDAFEDEYWPQVEHYGLD